MSTVAKGNPPKAEARKASPINQEYETKAKYLLRSVMAQRGVKIEELAERLNKMGVEISPGGLANKISRGGFNSAFLLQCMAALEMELVALKQ